MFGFLKNIAKVGATTACGFNIRVNTNTLIAVCNRPAQDAGAIKGAMQALFTDIELGMANGMPRDAITRAISSVAAKEPSTPSSKSAIAYVLSNF